MLSTVRKDYRHSNRIRALGRHLQVARPALVVTVAVEREHRTGQARDAISAIVVATFAVGGMNPGNILRGTVRACVEVKPNDRHARRQDRLHDRIRREEENRVR